MPFFRVIGRKLLCVFSRKGNNANVLSLTVVVDFDFECGQMIFEQTSPGDRELLVDMS